jgi:hypothetical protein
MIDKIAPSFRTLSILLCWVAVLVAGAFVMQHWFMLDAMEKLNADYDTRTILPMAYGKLFGLTAGSISVVSAIFMAAAFFYKLDIIIGRRQARQRGGQ